MLGSGPQGEITKETTEGPEHLSYVSRNQHLPLLLSFPSLCPPLPESNSALSIGDSLKEGPPFLPINLRFGLTSSEEEPSHLSGVTQGSV
jgi:hypothetical protein